MLQSRSSFYFFLAEARNGLFLAEVIDKLFWLKPETNFLGQLRLWLSNKKSKKILNMYCIPHFVKFTTILTTLCMSKRLDWTKLTIWLFEATVICLIHVLNFHFSARSSFWQYCMTTAFNHPKTCSLGLIKICVKHVC